MSDQPVRRGATYEDLEKLPPEVIGELVEGDLYASQRCVPNPSRHMPWSWERSGRAKDFGRLTKP